MNHNFLDKSPIVEQIDCLQVVTIKSPKMVNIIVH